MVLSTKEKTLTEQVYRSPLHGAYFLGGYTLFKYIETISSSIRKNNCLASLYKGLCVKYSASVPSCFKKKILETFLVM